MQCHICEDMTLQNAWSTHSLIIMNSELEIPIFRLHIMMVMSGSILTIISQENIIKNSVGL
jgi:hypothetical protein